MSDNGYDETPQGQQLISLLRRHAPPVPDVARARAAILQSLPEGRLVALRWAGSAVAAAAAVMIAVVLLQSPPEPVPMAPPATESAPAPMAASRGPAAPRLVAVVRGPSAQGWRIDAGLKDGLRVGDRLEGAGGIYTVSAVGIFDSRVHGDHAPTRGEKLSREINTPALLHARSFEALGGDPGAFLDLGAIFEALPTLQARVLGISDGRALVVTEVIRLVLRDFDGQPQATLAANLGLRAGDVLAGVNGFAVSDLNQLAGALEWTRRSGKLQATVIRDGRTLELQTR